MANNKSAIDHEMKIAYLGPDISEEGQKKFAEAVVRARTAIRPDYYEAQAFVNEMPPGFFKNISLRRYTLTVVSILLIITVVMLFYYDVYREDNFFTENWPWILLVSSCLINLTGFSISGIGGDML